jgi:hypothetical protein
MEDQLLSYVSKNLKKGVGRALLREKLLSVGWNELQIAQAFSKIDNPQIIAPDQVKIEEVKKPKLSFPGKQLAILTTVILLVVAIGGGGTAAFIHFFVNKHFTSLDFISDDAQFYLGISVKEHPQVKKLTALTKKLPAGERLIKELDKYRMDIFGKKDPFGEILDMANEEIFLAKVSNDKPDPKNPLNVFEQLVNIVQLKDPKEVQSKMSSLESDPNILFTKTAYSSAQIAKYELKDQKQAEGSKSFDTGPIPYGVTLPLSKSIFATAVDNYVIAAGKESDIQKIVDLISQDKEKKLKNIETDEEHNEIAKHFPKEYLFKFYQKQVLDPFGSIIPTSSLPVVGTNYDTQNQNAASDNAYTTKMGLSIVAQDNGVDFTSYQITNHSKVTQSLKHGFSIDGSLASKLPATLDSKTPLFYGELKDVKGTIQDQLDQLEEVAKNSNDENQKKSFDQIKQGIKEAKKAAKEEFGVDPDQDLLSWMDSNAAILVLTSSQKAPEVLFVFDVKDSQDVLTKLSKLRLKNYAEELKQQEVVNRDQNRRSNLSAIQYDLKYYLRDNKKYPDNLSQLVPKYAYSDKSLKDPKTSEFYQYRLTNGGRGYQVSAKMELSAPLVITEVSPAVTYSYDDTSSLGKNEIPKLSPTGADYKNQKIFSIPIYDWEGEKFAMRYTAYNNLAAISFGATEQSLKDLIDFSGGETLAKDPKWQEQFSRAPKMIGGIFYFVPENVMGMVDYFLAKMPEYKDQITEYEDAFTVARGYLKAFRSLGGTVTQEGKVLISNTFINIVQLPQDETKKVEDAFDRLLSKTGSQARDEETKSNVGQIATASEAYYTSVNPARYPDSLEALVTSSNLRTLPKQSSGENYGYLVCENGQKAVVFGKLEGGTYFVWNSERGSAYDSKNSSPPTNCSVTAPVLGISDQAGNFFETLKEKIKL